MLANESRALIDEISAVQELIRIERVGLKVTMVCDPRFISLPSLIFEHRILALLEKKQ
jgi:hypothetical protein